VGGGAPAAVRHTESEGAMNVGPVIRKDGVIERFIHPEFLRKHVCVIDSLYDHERCRAKALDVARTRLGLSTRAPTASTIFCFTISQLADFAEYVHNHQDEAANGNIRYTGGVSGAYTVGNMTLMAYTAPVITVSCGSYDGVYMVDHWVATEKGTYGTEVKESVVDPNAGTHIIF
jgi:hypothetical protein